MNDSSAFRHLFALVIVFTFAFGMGFVINGQIGTQLQGDVLLVGKGVQFNEREVRKYCAYQKEVQVLCELNEVADTRSFSKAKVPAWAKKLRDAENLIACEDICHHDLPHGVTKRTCLEVCALYHPSGKQ